MAGRPEILFPLFADVETLQGVGPKTAKHLAGLEIARPRDLLFTLPHSVVDRRRRGSIREVVPPATVTVEVSVTAHRPPRKKGGPWRVAVEDGQTSFHLVFFHARADWLERHLPVGGRRVVS
ncbi:MAG: ATP-dependent DNA helicase RecG, partial [Alphaproteobacteria bacterium HGW-Alphaproteobacteria-2]